MSINLMNSVLNGCVYVDDFNKWIRNDQIKDDILSKITVFECSQTEFISYLLNYIHEDVTSTLNQFTNNSAPNCRSSATYNSMVYSSHLPETKSELQSTGCDTTQNFFYSAYKAESSGFHQDKNKSRECNETPLKLNNTSTPTKKYNMRCHPKHLNKSSSSVKPKRFESNKYSNRPSHKLASSFCLGDFLVTKNNSAKSKTCKVYDSKEATQLEVHEQQNVNSTCSSTYIPIAGLGDEMKPERHNWQARPQHEKQRKRINPTKIKSERPISRPSFSDFVNSSEHLSPKFNRMLLQEESRLISQNISILPRATSRTVAAKTYALVEPEFKLVTFKNELDILSHIFCNILQFNLAANSSAHVKLLLSFIVAKFQIAQNEIADDIDYDTFKNEINGSVYGPDDAFGSGNELQLLRSVHNCVYLASRVLLHQFQPLRHIDQATIRFIAGNARLNEFSPELVKSFTDSNHFGGGRNVRSGTPAACDTDEGCNPRNVFFVSETDTRDNFPSDASFHAFRKQRDLFYEILDIWEANHLTADWQFGVVLAGKIKTLLTLCLDPVNYLHFAKLFTEQLLGVCSRSKNDETQPLLLNSLPNLDAKKLSKLENRLTIKTDNSGLNVDSDFNAHEEFYKDFILTASSAQLEQHLLNNFKHEIYQLNDTVFYSSEVEDNASRVDQATRKLYVTCLKRLTVLAKFVGFIDSKPYKTGYIPKGKIFNSQFELRQNFIPSLNIAEVLTNAVKNKKLIISVPWIVKYIGLLDYITIRLPYFTKIYETLFEIYYTHNIQVENSQKIPRELLLKYSLSWLFERPFFPQELYFKFLSDKYDSQNCKSPQTEDSLILEQGATENLHLRNVKISEVSCRSLKADALDLVDQAVLYSCCPFLNEVRSILLSNTIAVERNATARYIRPVSTAEGCSALLHKRLKSQLEEAFFHGQNSSVRKTVDFVIERVTSLCVKHICGVLVPAVKKEALDLFQKYLQDIGFENCTDPVAVNKLKKDCQKLARDLSEKCCEDFKEKSQDKTNALCKSKCEVSINALVAHDVQPEVKETCVSIAVQHTTNRIHNWCQLHIHSGVFVRELVEVMDNCRAASAKKQNQKVATYRLPVAGRADVLHDADVISPVTLMIEIRELLWRIFEGPPVSADNVLQLVDKSSSCFKSRCDLNAMARHQISRLFLDLYLLLSTYQPAVVSESLTQPMVAFWRAHCTKEQLRSDLFARILCPRNVQMFECSQQAQGTWSACTALLLALLRADLLTREQFQEQAMTLFRIDMEQSMLEHFNRSLRAVMEDEKCRKPIDDDFTSIIEWLSTFCLQDDLC